MTVSASTRQRANSRSTQDPPLLCRRAMAWAALVSSAVKVSSEASRSQVVFSWTVMEYLLRGVVACLLANLMPDFLPVHCNLGRCGKTQSDRIAFDRDDGDRQSAVRHHNSFAELATEDEHGSS